MKILTRPSALIIIALLLTLSAAASCAFATTYTAMPYRPTGTVVAASPSLVGLNQPVAINILTYPGPSGPTYYAQNLVTGNLAGSVGSWQNISCTITSPDGTKNTFMPIDFTLQNANVSVPGLAEIVGSLTFYYTPTQLGNYSVMASFPGQTYTTDNSYANMNLSVYYLPSSSQTPALFTVQKDPVLAGLLNGYPWSPLPTNYWTNPVFTDNREWAAISGAWAIPNYDIDASNYNPFTTAPKSPHILWANQIGSSGIVGGCFGSLAYAQATGGTGNIVLDGKIYQNEVGTSKFDCIDLRTGQLLWAAPYSSSSTGLTGSQQLNPVYQTASQTNEGGVQEWLWGGVAGSNTNTSSTSWVQYSPFNGAVTRTIVNVPSDIMFVKWEDADPIFWCIQGNLNTWNTTKPLALSYCNLIKWDLSKLTTTVVYNNIQSNDWRQGIVFNVSVTNIAGQLINVGDNDFQGVKPFPYADAGVVIVRARNAMQMMAGFDYNTGVRLWVNNATVLNLDVVDAGIATSTSGPMIMESGSSGQFVAYNVKTGQEIWRASTGNQPWAMNPSYLFVYDNGTHYFGSYDGHVYAYDSSTGKTVWESDYVGADTENVFGNQAFNGASVGGGGVLYYSTSTTYSLEPRTRFHELVAINESTGHFLWALPMDLNPSAVAYGYLVGRSAENGVQYCIGAGQTATSVTAPMTSVTVGQNLLIQGTVMDISPGKPNTPAVADSDMVQWMDYLYGQNATMINSPPNVHGVTVRLAAVDPNNNTIDLGAITSDSSGQFAARYNPTLPGLYTIYATFDGSNSYYGSYAETHLTVEAAQPTSTSQAANPSNLATTSDLMAYIVVAAIAIIIAIAIVGIVLFRKR